MSYDHEKDTTKFNWNQQVVPLCFMGAGALLSIPDAKEWVDNRIFKTDHNVDDFMQYSPIAVMYLADATGFEAANHPWDQTKYLLITQASMGIIVGSMKYIFNVERPDGTDHSFPSGHTAFAFGGASVLHHEFKDSNEIIANAGYLLAGMTGVFRMSNDRHWVSDVFFGAGISMFISNIVYHYKPLENWDPFNLKKKKDVSWMPIIGGNQYGFVMNF